jgi:hypothetical protein
VGSSGLPSSARADGLLDTAFDFDILVWVRDVKTTSARHDALSDTVDLRRTNQNPKQSIQARAAHVVKVLTGCNHGASTASN